MKACVISD